MEQSKGKIIHLLHRASVMMHRGHHRLETSGKGAHHGQARLLMLLEKMDGASQKDLNEILGIRPASLSELIDRLAEGGYVERRQDEEDKRVVHVFMTEKGGAMAGEVRAAREEQIGGLLGGLDEEESGQLLALLEKLINGMEAFVDDAGEDGHGGCRGHGERGGHGGCCRRGGARGHCGHGMEEGAEAGARHGGHGYRHHGARAHRA